MASDESYREFAPPPWLTVFVECFWISTVRTAPTPTRYRVLPDGCMDLLFDFGGTTGRRASVVGTMTRPLDVVAVGTIDLLGVRFRPGGLPMFCTLNAAELADNSADLSDFWRSFSGELWHELAGGTLPKRLACLRRVLNARANRAIRPDPFLQHCIGRIDASRGNLRIAGLEKSTGLGARQLERKFSRQVGISPKTFARIVRFRQVAAAAKSKTSDWAALAAEFGFADQPHLAREFKALSGVTPSEFRRAFG